MAKIVRKEGRKQNCDPWANAVSACAVSIRALKKAAPQEQHGITGSLEAVNGGSASDGAGSDATRQPAGAAPNAATDAALIKGSPKHSDDMPRSVAAPECVAVPLEVVAYCKHIIAAQCRALAIANESKEYKKASEIRSKLEDAEKAMLAGAPSQNAELVKLAEDVKDHFRGGEHG